jgi:hypothetical protein
LTPSGAYGDNPFTKPIKDRVLAGLKSLDGLVEIKRLCDTPDAVGRFVYLVDTSTLSATEMMARVRRWQQRIGAHDSMEINDQAH